MNNKVVNYVQAVRDFDKGQGKKLDGFDYPLRSSEELEVVDYQKVTQEYVQYLEKERSEVIHIGK